MENLTHAWGGDSEEKLYGEAQKKKICPKCMILGTSSVIWGGLGTFWSDFIMQNHSV